jgi:hypothetical protein
MDYQSLAVIAAVPAVLIGQVYLLGRKMSEPEKMIVHAPGGLDARLEQEILQYKEWLNSVKLSYLTHFQFGAISVVVYQQENQPRYLSFFFHRRITFGIESYLENLTILDTGTGGNGGLLPRPGAYLQSMSNISLQEVWRLHLEGEAYLSKKFGYVWVPLDKPYEEILMEAIRIRMKYNRSQKFWPIRVLYRYFVTRHLIKNRTIAQQFP